MKKEIKQQRPYIGIGVIIIRNGNILIGERLSKYGSGTYQIPGGHLECRESFGECAYKEVREETGLEDIIIKGVVSINNDIAYDKHYVSIGILAESTKGEPYDAEPEKSKNWQWCNPDDLPQPMFFHSEKVIALWRSGKFSQDM